MGQDANVIAQQAALPEQPVDDPDDIDRFARPRYVAKPPTGLCAFLACRMTTHEPEPGVRRPDEGNGWNRMIRQAIQGIAGHGPAL